MALRNTDWKEDVSLKAKLTAYVQQGMQRKEILDFVIRDFGQYAWSVRTLDRRLRYFDIFYTDETVTLNQIQQVVQKELDGPGKLLGYRGLHKKIRQVHQLNVPRDVVYATLTNLDPEGLEERRIECKKKKKGHFTTRGPNWVHSLDGHGKLMGYQQDMYPLAVYGCIDTASRKLLWLKVWTRNCDPKVIARWYFEWLYETKTIAAKIRVDRGTETGIMTTMHAFLRQLHNDMPPNETVIFGPSTANQIERWWRELHHRLEKFFKIRLSWLKDQGYYDPHQEEDRMLLAFLLIPVIQKEADVFKDTVWNTHRIRAQKETFLPDGIPDHIYNFPEEYGLIDCGFPLTEAHLEEAAHVSGVLDVPDDFLEAEFRQTCQRLLPNVDDTKPSEFVDKFLFLKESYLQQQPQQQH